MLVVLMFSIGFWIIGYCFEDFESKNCVILFLLNFDFEFFVFNED